MAVGHAGIRRMFGDFYDHFGEISVEFSEIRDLGERIVAISRIRTPGTESGAHTETPWGYLAEFKHGKVIRVRTYLDPKEALEAAGSAGSARRLNRALATPAGARRPGPPPRVPRRR